MSKEAPKKQPVLLRLLILLLTAALLLGGVALVAYRDRFNLDALRRWLEYRNLGTSATGEAVPFPYAGGGQASFAYLSDGIVTASDSGARYYSFSGEQYAEQVLSLEKPVLSASGSTAVVYDAGGQHLFVFRERKEAFSLTLEGNGDLLSARVNDQGWLVVTAQESGYKGVVTVYDSTYTKELIRINLSSTFVVDAAISPDGKTVAVVTMGQEGGSFQSQVRFYPTDQKEPKAVMSLGNTMVLDLDYEKNRLWVLGEQSVTILDPDGSKSSSYSLGGQYLKGGSLGGEGFAVLLLGRYRAGAANQVVTVGPEGQELGRQTLAASVLALDAAGRYVGLLAGDSMSIYTAEFSPYSTLNYTQNARHISMADTGAAVLANAQQVWLCLPA